MIKKTSFQKALCLLLTLAAALCLFSAAAYASQTETADFYLSYKKYMAAENPDGSKTVTYNDVTDQIANLLEEGLRRYEAGTEKDDDEGYYKPFTNAHVR